MWNLWVLFLKYAMLTYKEISRKDIDNMLATPEKINLIQLESYILRLSRQSWVKTESLGRFKYRFIKLFMLIGSDCVHYVIKWITKGREMPAGVRQEAAS